MYPSTRRNYTDEFKTQAVALAKSVGRTEAARQLEMSVKTPGRRAGSAKFAGVWRGSADVVLML